MGCQVIKFVIAIDATNRAITRFAPDGRLSMNAVRILTVSSGPSIWKAIEDSSLGVVSL
jgi:hypothetical protein